jgi:hypothetical protein
LIGDAKIFRQLFGIGQTSGTGIATRQRNPVNVFGTQSITSQHDGDATLIPRNAEYVAQVPDKWSKPFEASSSKKCKVNIIHATEETKCKKTKVYRGPQTEESTLFLMDPTQKTSTSKKHSSHTSAYKNPDPTGEGSSKDLDHMASLVEEELTNPHEVPSLPDLSKDIDLTDDSETEPEVTPTPSADPKKILAILNIELALSDESSDDEEAQVPSPNVTQDTSLDKSLLELLL